jgi:hypothetical protein
MITGSEPGARKSTTIPPRRRPARSRPLASTRCRHRLQRCRERDGSTRTPRMPALERSRSGARQVTSSSSSIPRVERHATNLVIAELTTLSGRTWLVRVVPDQRRMIQRPSGSSLPTRLSLAGEALGSGPMKPRPCRRGFTRIQLTSRVPSTTPSAISTTLRL